MRFLTVLGCLLVFVWVSPSFGFDFDQYRQSDLDQLLATPKIKSGVKMVLAQKLHFRAVLAAPVQNCNADILKRTMIMQGNKKEAVDKLAITKCLNLRSAKGASLPVFIVDQTAGRLAREVRPGEVIEVYCEFLYISPAGPTLLVHEYKKFN